MSAPTTTPPPAVLHDRFAERLVRCALGLAVFGLGLRLIIDADVGLAPWDVFHQGLSEHTGIGIGWWIEIVGIAILLGSWWLLDQRPGLGTILNALEIGLIVDLSAGLLPTTDRLVVRIAMMVVGVLVVAVGSGVYLGAGLGAGPRDGLMIGLAERGLSVGVARTGIEAVVLAIGFVLGGSIGLGTVVFTLAIGPAVHVLLPPLQMRSGSRGSAAEPRPDPQ